MPTIKKGKHRPQALSLGLFFNKTSIRKRVLFHDNCRYLLPGTDQQDINKLFGLGYFWSIHKDSARFGWRYIPEMDRILIFAYCYVNGVRIAEKIGAVRLNQYYEFHLLISDAGYTFNLQNDFGGWQKAYIEKSHGKKFSYPAGLFFGGNRPAPQNISVEIKTA
jgi:hypothetical protein